MKINDLNGNKIKIGLQVKYSGTHTIGKVEKIIFKENIAWIKLDSADLYYRSDYIEVIEGKNLFTRSKKVRKTQLKPDQFKIEIPVEISDTTDGPGIGGG